MSAAAISDPTRAYCREARKLRCRLDDRPLERYQSLRDLARRHDNAQILVESPQLSSGPASEFAQEAARSLSEGLLTFSRRQALLQHADRLGIGRFEANLILAAVQHRHPITISLPPRGHPRLKMALLFILSQVVVVLAVWALAH